MRHISKFGRFSSSLNLGWFAVWDCKSLCGFRLRRRRTLPAVVAVAAIIVLSSKEE